MSMVFAGTDRFELIRRLGEGGFGTVYEAFDRQRSTRVALKLLRQAEGTPLYRFKREFRALADISHPNLVALDELLTDGWHWFFTMELVRGMPIVAYARPLAESIGRSGTRASDGCTLDEPRLRFTLSQLADALHTIHRAGIVHCDIKPSNVLVTPEGRVVVLDFGLVSERPAAAVSLASLQSSFDDLVVVGTPAYMAPEQATAERITPAADWYSVGVMLYQVLTGHLPFSGSNLAVIEAKRNGRPRPPTSLNRNAPADLTSLVMRLLDPDPARRPSGDAVLQCIGRTDQRPQRGSIGRMPDVLLGRDPHLRRLTEAGETAMRGETAVAFVSGLSGMGKTTLIHHFLQEQRAREPDLLVLTSRCYERESMPYKAIDPLVDAVAQHLQRLRDIEVARLMPRDVAILARLFPVLLGVDEVRRAPQHAVDTIDALTVRQRAAAALRDLLFRLAARAPLMLVIDDLQWGDIDSASILQEVLRPPEAPPLLLIVAFRTEDATEARLLRALNRSVREASLPKVYDIEVGALNDEDARELATSLTAGAADALQRSDAIARESGGNPFFVHELAQHSLTVGGATTLDAVVRDRVRALPEAAHLLMRAVALSAQSIPMDVALAAAGLTPQDRELLQLLRASRLVRGRPDEPNVEAYHDRIRESIVGQMQQSELAAWHCRLGTAWEQSGVARPETLVAHFEAAGDIGKTRQYAVAAAEKAQEALAFDRASEFYALLVRLEGDNDRRRRWLIMLGQTLANAGRGYDASAAFLTALSGSSADEAIELERRAATELIRAGYLDEATEVLERLFPKVHVRSPGSDRRALLSLLGYRLLLAIRGTRFRERSESQITSGDLRRIDVLTSISPPLCLSSVMQGTALNVQAMWHALRSGEPRRVVISLTALAAQTAVGGARTEHRARALVKEAQSLAVRLHDPWATGRTVLAEGIVLKLNGHWKQGAERLKEASEIFAGCTGVRWEIETAQMLIHDALYWMGEWGRLAREMPARRQEAEQRGDLYSATHVSARLSPLLHLAADRVDQARSEAERGLAQWTKRNFHLQHRFGVCTDVDIDLYSGQPESAARRLATAWPDLRAMLFIIQHHRIEMVFYRARVALALAASGDSSALRRARRDARRLNRERAPWAHALARLIQAGAARTRGRLDRAKAELEAAEVELRRCDMHLYAAAAQFRRGHLIGGDAGRGLIAAADQWMRDQQVVNPPRLVNLFTPGAW
jgi:serine/threonine protein kinase